LEATSKDSDRIMFPTIFITGGCRSGKSGRALDISATIGGGHNHYLATCVPQDEEMRARVSRHQKERGADWLTIEEPLELPAAIACHGKDADVILIDCLTMWVSNLMAADLDDEAILDRVAALCETVAAPPCPLVIVSNEVGAGIVPENALARRFRDLAGWTNQRLAAVCRQVIWMVAGIPVTIKPSSHPPNRE
jgi:adenosylcobinamide kinase / adenosylcobinamide-phosphate guanylyltransferase